MWAWPNDVHGICIGFASDLHRICVQFVGFAFRVMFFPWENYKGAASECVAQGIVLYRAPNAPWLLLFASSCEGKGNNECKSHAPMGHRSEDEIEFRMQRCHAGQRSAAAARSCLRQDGELRPATGMGKTFTTTRSSLNQAGSGW